MLKRKKTIPLPQYDTSIIIINGSDYELIKERFGHDIDMSKDQAATFIFDNDVYIIFDQFSHGIIAHEAFHALNRIFHYRGIKYTALNDENMAYCLEYLVNEITKILYRPSSIKIKKMKVYKKKPNVNE